MADDGVAEFKSLLRDNRRIVLVHKGERYKARTVIEVLYSKVVASPCHSCYETNSRSTYVIMVEGEIVFLIDTWDGCDINSDVETFSFDNLNKFREHLMSKKKDHIEILSKLFPSSSSSSSTDSY